jgi:hypothetical protein
MLSPEKTLTQILMGQAFRNVSTGLMAAKKTQVMIVEKR